MKILSLENIKFDSELKKNGVYKIYLLNNNKSVKINRFMKSDLSGLIYIGAAEKTSLEYRLTCFLKSKSPSKQNNHTAGNKINKNDNLKIYINSYKLGYEVVPCKNAKEQEKIFLDAYRNNFGEVPPLNG